MGIFVIINSLTDTSLVPMNKAAPEKLVAEAFAIILINDRDNASLMSFGRYDSNMMNDASLVQ